MHQKHALKLGILFYLMAALAAVAPCAKADDDDPPSRVARLAYVQGSVSFQPAGTEDWVLAGLNRPVTMGDRVWSDHDGRVELQLDGSLIRLSNDTGFSFLNLGDNVTQIQLTAGTILLRVRRLDENETYEIDTPNLAFSVLRPGLYKISVDESGVSSAIKIRTGQGEVTGGGAAYNVRAGDSFTFTGTDQLIADPSSFGYTEDEFEAWAANRDRHGENSRSARFVSPDVVGYEDLDDHGSWSNTREYGDVWFPHTEPGWAPYRYGHWAYIAPWGYTWVDDQPWGFAPFHYGRWIYSEGRWGWVPAPPRVQGVAYVRPVYAPALVAWVGGGGFVAGATVAWFPLGPREVYVPSYPVSRIYVNNVNVSNTKVDVTVVNNYYNTTIVNNNVNVTNVKYVNQGVPGAVVATTPQAFTSAQSIAKNSVKVDQRAVATAPVRAFTPAVVPAKEAVLGSTAAAAKPPAALQTRAVVANVPPPPPPPSFEKRQEAIKANGGKPLSNAQVRQIQPVAAHAGPPVKIAPAAKPVTPESAQTNRPGHPANSRQAEKSEAGIPNATDRAGAPSGHPADRPPERSATSNNVSSSQGAAQTPAADKSSEFAPSNSRQPEGPSDRPTTSKSAFQPSNQPATTNASQAAEWPSGRPKQSPTDHNNGSIPSQPNRPTPPSTVHPSETAVQPHGPAQPSSTRQSDKKQQQAQDELLPKQIQARQPVQQQQQTQQVQNHHSDEPRPQQERQKQGQKNESKPQKSDRPSEQKP